MNVYIFYDYDGEICSVSVDFITGLSLALKGLCGIVHSHVGNYFYVCDKTTKEVLYAGFLSPDTMWESFWDILSCQVCELH